MDGDSLFLLHWDGRISLFSVAEVLSQMPNDELLSRTLVHRGSGSMEKVACIISHRICKRKCFFLNQSGWSQVPTWFCVRGNSVAFYHKSCAHLLEYKL